LPETSYITGAKRCNIPKGIPELTATKTAQNMAFFGTTYYPSMGGGSRNNSRSIAPATKIPQGLSSPYVVGHIITMRQTLHPEDGGKTSSETPELTAATRCHIPKCIPHVTAVEISQKTPFLGPT
jgi:hypothetical protein